MESYGHLCKGKLRLAVGMILVLLSCLAAVGVEAANSRGIIVSPARITARVQPGDKLPEVQVKNTTKEPVKIDLYVGRGEHRLDGSPIYLDSPKEREWGAQHLRLSPTTLRLGPGESGTITISVGDLLGVSGGVYPVIFLEIAPSEETSGARAISRLAIIALLDVVGGAPADLSVATLQIEQAHPGGAIGVFPLITNHGKTHATFSGHIEIAREGGGEIGTRLPVQPLTVLPGCSRQTSVWWQPQTLPEGTYRVTPHLVAEGRPIKAREWVFQVIQPYAVATLQGDVVSWSPKRVSADSPWIFRAIVHNSGTKAWRGLGNLIVTDVEGNVRAQVPLESTEVVPGGSSGITQFLPPLNPGRYSLRMTLSNDGVPLVDTEEVLDVVGGETVAHL
ncbi:MAG: hypothetical protein GX322_04970 [Firmicutes bacterium]|nr:hypothetical protein [Bacillota bacterium]